MKTDLKNEGLNLSQNLRDSISDAATIASATYKAQHLKSKKKGYQMVRVSKSVHFLTKLKFFATNEFMSSRLPLRLGEAKTSSLSNFF
jgi:hypothetical protein